MAFPMIENPTENDFVVYSKSILGPTVEKWAGTFEECLTAGKESRWGLHIIRISTWTVVYEDEIVSTGKGRYWKQERIRVA